MRHISASIAEKRLEIIQKAFDQWLTGSISAFRLIQIVIENVAAIETLHERSNMKFTGMDSDITID